MSYVQKSRARSRRRRADRAWALSRTKRGPLVLHGRLAKAADKLGLMYGTEVSAGVVLLPDSWAGPKQITIGPGVYGATFTPAQQVEWDQKMEAARRINEQLDEELRQALTDEKE